MVFSGSYPPWKSHPMGEARKEALKLSFDGSVRLVFHAATVSSDDGLLPYRDLDDALALTAPAGTALNDWRRGTNIRHSMTTLLRQAIYNRQAGYDVLNVADRLRRYGDAAGSRGLGRPKKRRTRDARPRYQ